MYNDPKYLWFNNKIKTKIENGTDAIQNITCDNWWHKYAASRNGLSEKNCDVNDVTWNEISTTTVGDYIALDKTNVKNFPFTATVSEFIKEYYNIAGYDDKFAINGANPKFKGNWEIQMNDTVGEMYGRIG